MDDITYLATSWGEMAYAESGGTGIPLLFLHGTGCDSEDWQSVIDILPSQLRCITLDFRGHGQSSIPTEHFTLANLSDDVIHLVNSIGIQKLTLVGHSLGGMVAMEVARSSSNVAGLVLLEGWTSLSSAGSAFDGGRFYGTLSQTKITKIQNKSTETRSCFEQSIWSSFWTTVIDFDAYSYLEHASIPIYEVFGGMGRKETTETKLRIPPNPNIQTIWVPNAGHYLPHECPAEVTELCFNFVKLF